MQIIINKSNINCDVDDKDKVYSLIVSNAKKYSNQKDYSLTTEKPTEYQCHSLYFDE